MTTITEAGIAMAEVQSKIEELKVAFDNDRQAFQRASKEQAQEMDAIFMRRISELDAIIGPSQAAG